jgi:hypothetical protein
LFASRAALAARSRGQLELFRARRERAELEAERTRGFQRLGRAVYGDDKAGTKAAREELDGITDRITEKEAEIETMVKEIDRRVQRAQAGGSPTERLEVPEPARVPEPWPPPDEGTPPTPEPEPPPPEPPPEPEHPPAPETRKQTAKSRKS